MDENTVREKLGPDPSSTDILRAAAKIIRITRERVPYGPPWGVADDAPRMVVSGALRPWGAPTVADTEDPDIADWIALASPDKADPWAALLDDVADLLDDRPTLGRQHVDGPPCDSLTCRIVHHALTLAGSIVWPAS